MTKYYIKHWSLEHKPWYVGPYTFRLWAEAVALGCNLLFPARHAEVVDARTAARDEPPDEEFPWL